MQCKHTIVTSERSYQCPNEALYESFYCMEHATAVRTVKLGLTRPTKEFSSDLLKAARADSVSRIREQVVGKVEALVGLSDIFDERKRTAELNQELVAKRLEAIDRSEFMLRRMNNGDIEIEYDDSTLNVPYYTSR